MFVKPIGVLLFVNTDKSALQCEGTKNWKSTGCEANTQWSPLPRLTNVSIFCHEQTDRSVYSLPQQCFYHFLESYTAELSVLFICCYNLPLTFLLYSSGLCNNRAAASPFKGSEGLGYRSSWGKNDSNILVRSVNINYSKIFIFHLYKKRQ